MWFVYIILCSDGTLYTGITNNLEKRLKQHNEGKGAKYTRGRGPVKLMVKFEFESKSLAAKEEYRIKQLNKQQKIALWTDK
jgi:putative endonuclease